MTNGIRRSNFSTFFNVVMQIADTLFDYDYRALPRVKLQPTLLLFTNTEKGDERYNIIVCIFMPLKWIEFIGTKKLGFLKGWVE